MVPFPFPSFLPLPSLPLPSHAAKRSPENQLGYSTVWELCKLPLWGPRRSPGRKRILVYIELKNRT